MLTQVEKLFGKIVVVNEILTDQQLDALAEHRDAEYPDIPISVYLLREGILTERQYDAICKVHRTQCAKLSLDAGDKFYGKAEPEIEPQPEPEPESRQERESSLPAEPPDVDYGAGKPFIDTPLPPKEMLAGGIRAYLKFAREIGASDLHISAGCEPFVRLFGRINYLRQDPLDGETTSNLLLEILDEAQKKRLEENWDMDFALHEDEIGRFRVNYYRQRHGLSACFRVVNDKVHTLAELNLPPSLENFTTHHQGIVLLTGSAGCGKSTTLAALVAMVNQKRKDHIITIEEPIEYVYRSDKCNITQREVRRHTSDFHVALRASLREDPDVIVVGEMRDLETISMAITAAETGHLVFGTLHTTNATRTVDRILDVFPPKQQAQIRMMVSESLRGVVSQQLVPRADGRGRVPAVEILVATPAVANMIREYKTFQLPSVLQTGKALGMQSMDDSLADLLNKGLITSHEAAYRAENRKRFEGAAS